MKDKFMEIFMTVLELNPPIDLETRLETLHWDSISQLTFASMLDDEMQLSISALDFRHAKTVQDLLNAAMAIV